MGETLTENSVKDSEGSGPLPQKELSQYTLIGSPEMEEMKATSIRKEIAKKYIISQNN